MKAVLLLDNAPSHPPAEELKTVDGAIFVMYMPPNVTPLIQPMDQNILRLTKLYYRKSLLSSVVAKGEGVADALKTLTIRDAVIHLHMAWQQVQPSMISKCWDNILGKNKNEDDIPLARLQEIWNSERAETDINDTIDLLHVIGPVEYTTKDVEEWNKDVSQNSDLENDQECNDSEDSDCEVLVIEEKKVSHSEVLEALKVVSQWTNQNPVDISDILSLRRIEEKAVALNISQKKVQTKITSYFK